MRHCLSYGPTALKPPYPAPLDLLLPEPVIEGEDILNLNVWTPDPGATGLPVLAMADVTAVLQHLMDTADRYTYRPDPHVPDHG